MGVSLLLLRLRYHLTRQAQGGVTTLLAEDALLAAYQPADTPDAPPVWLAAADVEELLKVKAAFALALLLAGPAAVHDDAREALRSVVLERVRGDVDRVPLLPALAHEVVLGLLVGVRRRDDDVAGESDPAPGDAGGGRRGGSYHLNPDGR